MRDPKKPRIDYFPNPLVWTLLKGEVKRLLPGMSMQQRLDLLVTQGVWALQVLPTAPRVNRGNRAYQRADGSGTLGEPFAGVGTQVPEQVGPAEELP